MSRPERTTGHPGLIEDKDLTISVHYRQVVDETPEAIESEVRAAIEPFSDLLHLTFGKKVIEIRPSVAVDKGEAVRAISRILDEEGQGLLIYIGDDQTDEDAFAVLRSRDIAIKVGESASSRAAYFAKDTEEVAAFLHALLEWDT